MRGNKLLLWVLLALVLAWSIWSGCTLKVEAANCPELKVVFARGSGEARNEDQNYINFKKTLDDKLKTTTISYEFLDLDYPAVAINNLSVMAGAFFGAGEAYEFGDSVNAGVELLTEMVNDSACPGTKYVIGGYSQGAMVISKALSLLNPERIIYAATFGDPKIFLPEGEGLMPAACKGENLSDYRAYVPDCQAYKGLLGAYMPYEPADFEGKLGTWCNKRDLFCSSKFNIADHTAYVADNLYEDASKRIFIKVTEHFGVPNTAFSPHDTAFLIDSTGSMDIMINEYKDEILRLASETLDAGGRIALYDFRDLYYNYKPVERCNFETCTLELFESELMGLETMGGGDPPESALSASLHMMNKLDWHFGATKSVILLSDTYYLNPDRDGVVLSDVVELSKEIDPVNFYPVTIPYYRGGYNRLAEQTDGEVSVSVEEFHEVVNKIMARSDSLPIVEEGAAEIGPELSALNVEELSETAVKIRFESVGEQTIVILNDAVLGITEENEVTINGLDRTVENVVGLVPVGDGVKGEAVEAVKIEVIEDVDTESETQLNKPEADVSAEQPDDGYGGEVTSEEVAPGKVVSGETAAVGTVEKTESHEEVLFVIPKAPNTGRH